MLKRYRGQVPPEELERRFYVADQAAADRVSAMEEDGTMSAADAKDAEEERAAIRDAVDEVIGFRDKDGKIVPIVGPADIVAEYACTLSDDDDDE
jgi:hypothetical protein